MPILRESGETARNGHPTFVGDMTFRGYVAFCCAVGWFWWAPDRVDRTLWLTSVLEFPLKSLNCTSLVWKTLEMPVVCRAWGIADGLKKRC